MPKHLINGADVFLTALAFLGIGGYPDNVNENITLDEAHKIAKQAKFDSFTSEAWQKARDLLDFHQLKGVRLIPFGSIHYPTSLAVMKNPPRILYAKGNCGLLKNEFSVAIVGSRSASQYGLKVTERVTAHYAQKNYVIVSGLATGIDSTAHSSCLAHNGNTIAVLAHGLHRIYPVENTALAHSILDNGGLWISEHPLGIEPQKHFFVLRNRIQVGLSRFSIIVEATKKSGTMSHADYCLKATHPLYVVIPPDSKKAELASNYEGNFWLLEKRGALPIRSFQDYPA